MSNTSHKWIRINILLWFFMLWGCDVTSPHVLAEYVQWNMIYNPSDERMEAVLTFHLEVDDPSDMFTTSVEVFNRDEGLVWQIDDCVSTKTSNKRTMSWAITGDWRDLVGHYEVILLQRHGRETTINIIVAPLNIADVKNVILNKTTEQPLQFILFSKEHEMIGIYEEEHFTFNEQKEQYFYSYLFSAVAGVAIISGPFFQYKTFGLEEVDSSQ
jgi:hypothetical protein